MLTAALIYAAIALIGHVHHLEPGRPLVGTRAENVNGILFRAGALVADSEERSAFRDFARSVCALPLPGP